MMKGWHIWRKRISAALACVVVFVTAYCLVLPAITLDQAAAEADESIAVEEAGGLQDTGEVPEGSEGSAGSGEIAGSRSSDQEGAVPEEETVSSGEDLEEHAGEEEPADENGQKAQEEKNNSRSFPLTLTEEGEDYSVTVSFEEDALLPEDVCLRAEEIDQDTKEYEDYRQRALKAVRREEGEEALISYARFFDITFEQGGKEVEPAGPVNVVIRCENSLSGKADRGRGRKDRELSGSSENGADASAVNVVHFDPEDVKEPRIMDIEAGIEKNASVESVSFEADSFSVYGVIGTRTEKTVLSDDGQSYRITVTCGPDADIPEGAWLDVREILQGKGSYDFATEYETVLEDTASVLGAEAADLTYARFFDITIVGPDGREAEPARGALVDVSIRLDDAESKSLRVVHLGQEPELMDTEAGEDCLLFETGGFSVYAVVDAPEPAEGGRWKKVSSLEEIAQLGPAGFYMRNPSGFYFKDTVYNVNASRTGIEKVKPAAADPDAAQGAAVYCFEPVEGRNDQFHVYCLKEGQRYYIRQSGNSLTLTEGLSADTGSAVSTFTVSAFEGYENTFRMLGTGGYYWNMQGGDNGKGFCAYNSASDINARIQLEYYEPPENDPYSLGGKSFGIAYHDESATAAAMMAEEMTSGGQSRLAGMDLLIRENVLGGGLLLSAADSDITEWTFENVSGDNYYLSASAGGTVRYLVIDGGALSLTENKEEASIIRAVPGTGSNAGKWHFTSGNYALNLDRKAENGFNAVTGSGASAWLNLTEKSVLTEEDFRLYSARKVRVSDEENVFSGQKVVIYTRIWNDTVKRYEFYAVDHDGSLIRCYDNGDVIDWTGSQVNTALWVFEEGKNADGSVNYYYYLKNATYGTYLVPQMNSGQILYESQAAAGEDFGASVNLDGRRDAGNYTTIIAWDQEQYSYSGLKTENGRVVPCPLAEAEHFYFAVMDPRTQGELTTVDTVDGKAYGITMKMIDFNNETIGGPQITAKRDKVQTEFFGTTDHNAAGLLSTDLGEDGYPVTTDLTGHNDSLGELFTAGDLKDVNHLFIESIHNESGYFEYDSTQNFAHLNDNGRFTVYDQLLAVGTAAGPTRTHGQFLPYNEIDTSKIASEQTGNPSFTNQTDVTQKELDDRNPRKGEELYWVSYNDADYFFGMEMEAEFTQTVSGKDAWGHDIIFEFSGDDDFWFYVDGELVLDLGGVHPAMTGSINFRTGQVKSSRGSSTLYEIFKRNFERRGLAADQVSQKLDEIFTRKSNGQYVFKDYTTHTMKMFYMERGAGASNLRMRFNLAAVKPGTVVLNKTLSGTDSPSNDLIEIPYQVWYRLPSDEGEAEREYVLLSEMTGDSFNATFKDSVKNVPYKASFTPAGSGRTYQNVFFLHPGESCVIDLPDEAVDYYIAECGVDPLVYDRVSVNGRVLNGTSGETGAGEGRCDYSIPPAALKDRPQVNFDNHVSEGAMRTLLITKKLYGEDGERVLHYENADPSRVDQTLFDFRLYLGSENTGDGNLPPADLYSYYVKDEGGSYCRWDASAGRFRSLGITSYGELSTYMEAISDAEKESIVFRTSMYGSITGIPAGYSVEVRDLIVGTRWKAEEREKEIPRGYTLRLEDGYQRRDAGHEENKLTVPISGTMEVGSSPDVLISNQKGWGLSVEKVWTDRDFMKSHDSVLFAVYVKRGEGPGTAYTMVEDSVRELSGEETSLYYFFDRLQSGIPFENYEIFEVTADKAEDENGNVTYSNVQRIGEGEKITVGGTDASGVHHPEDAEGSGFEYTVHYRKGEQTDRNENVRTDTVTNSRPGIRFHKSDWEGNPLSGAVFTLTDPQGRNVAKSSYSSASDGLVTIAYLPEGTYTLTEISAPGGYASMEEALTIRVGDGREVEIGGGEGCCSLEAGENEDMDAVITIRNRRAAFSIRKVDSRTGDLIEGAHFALYRQVNAADGTPRKDYLPMTGYEDLTTDENGILSGIGMDLSGGTYYLTETEAAEGYDLPGEDICFSVGNDGRVEVESEAHRSWLSQEYDETSGQMSFMISVPNTRMKKVRFKKVDIASWQDSALAGARFDLCRLEGGVREEEALYTGLTSGPDGMLLLDGQEILELPAGSYHLVETKAPEGYLLKARAILITIGSGSEGAEVTYDEGTSLSAGGAGISYDGETKTYTLLISDSAGHELPSAGGRGTGRFYIPGMLMILTAGVSLVFAGIRRRKDRS